MEENESPNRERKKFRKKRGTKRTEIVVGRRDTVPGFPRAIPV